MANSYTPKREIEIDGDIARVFLTNGYVALIDSSDVSIVSGYNWSALVKPHTVYAVRQAPRGGETRPLIWMHKEILSVPGDKIVDHEDNNGLNNRRKNLRPATHTENSCNRVRPSNNKTGYKGVSFDSRSRKYRSVIRINGKQTHLGLFDDPADGYLAYCEAANDIHGQFARLA